jgi:hypothetical protein
MAIHQSPSGGRRFTERPLLFLRSKEIDRTARASNSLVLGEARSKRP